MKTIKGTVNLIGSTRITHNDGVTLTVLEIGNYALRKILITDYLETYLRKGEDVEVLVYKGLSSHMITAIRVNNKTYKISGFLLFFGFLLRTVIIGIPLIGASMLIENNNEGEWGFNAIYIGVGLTILYLYFKMKDLSDLIKF